MRWAIALLRSLRPGQWVKNGVVFAALVFSRQAGDRARVVSAATAFAAFCLAAGAVYLINDLFDRELDRGHPRKAGRPIAAGALPVGLAWVAALALAPAALALALRAGRPAAVGVALYLLLQLAYSGALRRLVLVDVLAIALGFVLRALVGAVAIDVRISPWLVLCTLFLALFCALGKRRAEQTALAGAAAGHRPALAEYTPAALDALLQVAASCAILSYALYTFNSVQSALLIWTVPLVVYGVLRYLLLLATEAPPTVEVALLRDPGLRWCVVGWVAAVLALLAAVPPQGPRP